MNPEIAKIEAYFREGRALWAVNPKLVQSVDFFELWETAHQPVSFRMKADEEAITICDHPVQLVGEGPRTASFAWDFSESCAVLHVETEMAEQKILLLFDYGEPLIIEQPLMLLDSREVSLGERLEAMYDVIAWMREHYPSRDVRLMTRRDFNEAMAEIAPHLDTTTFRVVKRTPFSRIRKLLLKAVEDMAEDELSDQLYLPLDGSYAVTLSPIPRAGVDFDAGMKPVCIELQPRTRWQVACDLRFVKRAAAALSEVEEGYVLDLTSAEILRRDGPSSWILQVPITRDAPIREGDRLQVFRRGGESLGFFFADLIERRAIVGRLAWNDSRGSAEQAPDLAAGQYYAQPRRGPALFISRLFDSTIQAFLKSGAFDSAALQAALGAAPATLEPGTLPDSDVRLDFSQSRAWAAATHDGNPIAIIQGPPGTGKTHVLEQVLRTFMQQGRRVLIAAPSHTAVDNVCKRILDLPLLRVGRDSDSLAPEVLPHWIGDINAVKSMAQKRRGKEVIYAGTHVGVMRDDVVLADLDRFGLFDVIVFDEAGMARMDEFLLCTLNARRVVLFGDHQQLPPFPLPDDVLQQLHDEAAACRRQWATIKMSAMEWLITERQVPVYLLQASYRCQNPRLMRFSSTLFYNARVKASAWAEYYRLGYSERIRRFPPSSLRFYNTSRLPRDRRRERMVFEGGKPGLENALEADLAVAAFYDLATRYKPSEITVIAPYRRQVKLIRHILSRDTLKARNSDVPAEADWEDFLRTRISTVDSFQGGESDAVITCYVRSNADGGIGFVDDPNRVNVAHTRCRREMVIIGDLECLKASARSDIFQRMERAIRRDGEIVDLLDSHLRRLPHSIEGGVGGIRLR